MTIKVRVHEICFLQVTVLQISDNASDGTGVHSFSELGMVIGLFLKRHVSQGGYMNTKNIMVRVHKMTK